MYNVRSTEYCIKYCNQDNIIDLKLEMTCGGMKLVQNEGQQTAN